MKNSLLIVFDIDDTLTKTATAHQEAFNRALKTIGIQEHGFDLNTFTHHTDSFISKEIYEKTSGKKFSNELKDKFENSLWNDIKQQAIQEVEGARAFVHHISKVKQIKFCFATGSLRRPAIHKLLTCGIPFHEEIVVASDDHYRREDIIKEVIRHSKKHYHIDHFDHKISMGDGIWDLKAAKNLGLEFIGIGEKNKEIMLENGMVHHFEDFRNWEAILESILNI